jgi:hypothetical protein
MPRFVLLYHDCPPDYERPSHWDFMLESGDVLRTWALEQLPQEWAAARAQTAKAHSSCPLLAKGREVAALPLGDHRLDYLTIEGPLSGNRGSVVRVAEGSFSVESETPTEWVLALTSSTMDGRVSLRRSETDASQWTLKFL